MRQDKQVSPYLKRPLRSLEEVLRARSRRLPESQAEAVPAAGNSNAPRSPAKSA